jgi:DNA-binding Lrp family transcriptional regulator
MVVKREVLESLISPPILKILKLFINNDDQTYYLREIAKLTRVPPASTYRILKQLVDNDIVKVNHVKRFKLYTFNTEDNRFLLDLFQDRKSAVAEFVRSIKEFPGVQLVVLHGKEEKNNANILVIGENMDTESIKRNALFISDKYKFNLILLTLTPDQYNQMSSMGLYPGKKKILFESDEVRSY